MNELDVWHDVCSDGLWSWVPVSLYQVWTNDRAVSSAMSLAMLLIAVVVLAVVLAVFVLGPM